MEKITIDNIRMHLRSNDYNDAMLAITSLNGAIQAGYISDYDLNTLSNEIMERVSRIQCIEIHSREGEHPVTKQPIKITRKTTIFPFKDLYKKKDKRLNKKSAHKKLIEILRKITNKYIQLIDNPDTYIL